MDESKIEKTEGEKEEEKKEGYNLEAIPGDLRPKIEGLLKFQEQAFSTTEEHFEDKTDLKSLSELIGKLKEMSTDSFLPEDWLRRRVGSERTSPESLRRRYHEKIINMCAGYSFNLVELSNALQAKEIEQADYNTFSHILKGAFLRRGISGSGTAAEGILGDHFGYGSEHYEERMTTVSNIAPNSEATISQVIKELETPEEKREKTDNLRKIGSKLVTNIDEFFTSSKWKDLQKEIQEKYKLEFKTETISHEGRFPVWDLNAGLDLLEEKLEVE